MAAFPVGMWTRVGELVAVRGSATEEAPFDGGLSRHRGADPCLDPVALALAHAAIEAHDKVMCVRAGIDGATNLWPPQLDAVVDEDRERQPELVAIKTPAGARR
jgi:hypothetical protein